MKEYVSDIAFTDTVKNIQKREGSRDIYAHVEQRGSWHDSVTKELAEFISKRDSFYIATVNSEGYPYIQHRGGPRGFLKIIDNKTIGFADFSGNRQYISYGNITDNNKVCLFLMDYPNRKRIKIWGTASVREEEKLINELTVDGYKAVPERVFLIHVDAWDINCPKHIVQRYTLEEIQGIDMPIASK